MAKLIHFVNESKDEEFVVIFDEDEPDTSDFTSDGFSEKRSVSIDGDVSLFPTYRALVDEARG